MVIESGNVEHRSRVSLAWLRITMVLLDTLLLDRLWVLLLIHLQLENSSVCNKISSTQSTKQLSLCILL